MLKEEVEKFRCYGEVISFNEVLCLEDKCVYLIACKILCGNVVVSKLIDLVELLHNTHTSGEVMALLQKNHDVSYNASKMAIKRWRKKNDM
jgi:hypothetical protein